MSEHLLLTVLGASPRVARYTLNGKDCEANLAPAALIELLPSAERPDRVLALCTPRAKQESFPVLTQALSDICPVEAIDVSLDPTSKGVNDYLQTVCNIIPATSRVELSVDVTHGFRHFSFLTYIAVLYLTAFRRIKIRGAYYGLFEGAETSPFLDLQPLVELPNWVHALRVLHTTGSTLPIAEVLSVETMDQSTENIVREFKRFSAGYLSGLPIEVGRHAHTIREYHLKPLRKLLKRDHCIPLANELVEQMDRTLCRFAYDRLAPSSGWKRRVKLSEKELNRQANLIDDLLRSKNIASALGLINEWTVSWITWRLGDATKWLDYADTRRKSANLLGAFAAISKDGELRAHLSDEQSALGQFWAKLSGLRNGYHHHGMRGSDMINDTAVQEDLNSVKTYWAKTLSQRPDFPLSLGQTPSQRILITALGKSPGVLFSALRVCQSAGGEPDLCFVICSRESEWAIKPAVQQAQYSGKVELFRLDDPYGGGRREIDRVVKVARAHLIGAMDVTINITGGTTLMGLAAEALANEARRLACPVRRFGLIDSRPPSQQASEPYTAGKPFWLDDQSEPPYDG